MDDAPILVVDDEPVIRYFVAELLRLEGYSVETAGNGQEALETIERRRVSIILLDMQMPVLDGPGLSRELTRRGVDLPIVLMSASREAPDCAIEMRAVACLSKPFGVGDLLDVVRRVHPAGRAAGRPARPREELAPGRRSPGTLHLGPLPLREVVVDEVEQVV